LSAALTSVFCFHARHIDLSAASLFREASPSYQPNHCATVFVSFLLLVSQSFFLVKFFAEIYRSFPWGDEFKPRPGWGGLHAAMGL